MDIDSVLSFFTPIVEMYKAHYTTHMSAGDWATAYGYAATISLMAHAVPLLAILRDRSFKTLKALGVIFAVQLLILFLPMIRSEITLF